jgi:hypothetical protein
MALLMGVALAAAASGDVRFASTEEDLGFIYRDEPQKIVYSFTNTSADSVRVYEIEPSCDCTTAQAVPETVGPGEDGRIVAFFDPAGYEGKGPVTEYLRVHLSDPESPEVLLTFSTEVGIGPEPEPRSLSFGRICKGRSDTLSFLVKPPPDKPLEILSIEADTPCIEVLKESSDSRSLHRYEVVVTNTTSCGTVAGFITLHTDDGLRPRIRVPVTVCLLGRIAVEPDVVAFGPTLAGDHLRQTVRVYCREGKEFGLAGAESSVPELEPEIEQVDPSTYEIRVRVKEDASAGRVTGSLFLETDCPDEPPIEVRVTGYVRSNG